MSLFCSECGNDLPSRRTGGLYEDGDELTCSCGWVWVVGVEDVGEDAGYAYLSGGRCPHGVPDGCARDDEGDPRR